VLNRRGNGDAGDVQTVGRR